MRTMSFQELQVFSEVARSGGITAAAEKLGMAKSAVSKQLSQLEQRLQVKLLARSSRRVSLTPEGRRLLPRVESIIAEGERLVDDAHEEVVKPAGVVRIAASPEFGALVAQRFLPPMLEQYPDLAVTMKLGYGFEDLQDPSIDLAFRIGHVNDDRLVAHPLGEFRRILVASPDFVAHNPLVKPTDLELVNCLVFSSNTSSTSWTLQHRQKPKRIEQVNVKGNIAILGFTALLGVAETGAGVGYVPDFITTRAIKDGRLVHCLPEWASQPTPVFIAYRFGAERIGRVKAVIDAARLIVPGLLDPQRVNSVTSTAYRKDRPAP
ncbi:MAG: LysR family transcriptional regulator [Gammaproteobacteria bacterium]